MEDAKEPVSPKADPNTNPTRSIARTLVVRTQVIRTPVVRIPLYERLGPVQCQGPVHRCSNRPVPPQALIPNCKRKPMLSIASTSNATSTKDHNLWTWFIRPEVVLLARFQTSAQHLPMYYPNLFLITLS